MNDRDLMFLPAHEQRRMMLDGQISSVELTQAAFRRIAEPDSQLNAFMAIDQEGALATAAECDRMLASGDAPGSLHGVPVAVKDLEVTNGLRTTFGSSAFADWVPDFDSAVVARLRAADAVIIGKTNTPEFGAGSQTFNPVFGPTQNPWNESLTPGGSSGGAAAALAAGPGGGHRAADHAGLVAAHRRQLGQRRSAAHRRRRRQFFDRALYGRLGHHALPAHAELHQTRLCACDVRRPYRRKRRPGTRPGTGRKRL